MMDWLEHRFTRPLFIAANAALALFVFHTWGLRGTAALLLFWGLLMLGFFWWHRRAQRRIAEPARGPYDRAWKSVVDELRKSRPDVAQMGFAFALPS